MRYGNFYINTPKISRFGLPTAKRNPIARDNGGTVPQKKNGIMEAAGTCDIT